MPIPANKRKSITRKEFNNLDTLVKDDLIEYNEIKHGDHSKNIEVLWDILQKKNRFEILEMYMEWHGIQGYNIPIASICGLDDPNT